MSEYNSKKGVRKFKDGKEIKKPKMWIRKKGVRKGIPGSMAEKVEMRAKVSRRELLKKYKKK